MTSQVCGAFIDWSILLLLHIKIYENNSMCIWCHKVSPTWYYVGVLVPIMSTLALPRSGPSNRFGSAIRFHLWPVFSSLFGSTICRTTHTSTPKNLGSFILKNLWYPEYVRVNNGWNTENWKAWHQYEKNTLNANNAHLKSLYYMVKLSNSMCILNVTCRDAEVESELY